MGVRKLFVPFASAAITAALICAMPSASLGASPGLEAEKKTPAAEPKPDVPIRIYTNDDLGWHAATPTPANEIQPGETQGAVTVPPASNPSYVPALAKSALSQEQDPRWYGEQLDKLEAELAAVDSKEADLLAFRSSGSTQPADLPVGLVLNAPCEGITTDNLIAQLNAQRSEINEQINGIEDTARTNGLPSAVVEQAAAAAPAQPTAQEEQAKMTSRYQQLSGELAETEAVKDDVQEQAASENIKLIPPTPEEGGNMTTDMLERLDSQAALLQNELNNVEDNARALGARPGDLR